jgi:hypothetical protein
MAADDTSMQIRSFRVCFQLERRIHKLDRWRIPLPYGLPVRGLLYGAAILAAVLVAARLPLLSSLVGALHPIVRYGLLPVAGGYLLTELKLDGRSGHSVAISWLRMRFAPTRVCAFRPVLGATQVRLGALTVAADGRGPRLRRGVIDGEGPVVLRGPVAFRARGRTLRARPEGAELPPRARQVNLRPGQRIVIG